MPRYTEHKILPYAPEDVFDLVADVARYPEFLPWCIGARVTKHEGDVLYADLIIGWKMVRETFTSRVSLTRPGRIHVDYIEGPMRYMNNEWTFTRTANGYCAIDFVVDFEFKSKSLQAIMGVFFNEAVRRMVSAFEERAQAVLKTA